MMKALVEDLLHSNSADKSVGRDHGRAHTRQVLLQSGAEHLQEHDVANLLLAMNNSKIDKAFDSVEVIEHFGSLYRLLTAECSDLRRFGIGQDTIDVFDLVHEASRRLASVETRTRILLSDTNALALHLGVGTTLVGSNHLVALFLNSRNHLLEQVSFSLSQSLSDVSLKIGKYMLSTNATSLLLATIHKGNSPLPTGRDTELPTG